MQRNHDDLRNLKRPQHDIPVTIGDEVKSSSPCQKIACDHICMTARPVKDYQELSIIRTRSLGGNFDHPLCVEYRYEPALRIGAIRHIVGGISLLTLAYYLQVLGWKELLKHHWAMATSLFILYVVSKSTTSESALAFPNLGIQLESTSSLVIPFPFITSISPLNIPLGRSKRFVPLSALKSSSAVFLHEAFRRWSVVYYLGILCRPGLAVTEDGGDVEGLEVLVVFPDLQPRFPVLLEVYYGLRETLFDDYNDDT